MSKMDLYNAVAEVPINAKKTIGAGRLKGMTDINPMWRIKALTEQFGACGFGWSYTIDKQWLEEGAEGVVCGFCNVTLYVKGEDGEWSRGIAGTGGSTFIAKESKGLFTSDEVYKMALTDALSVACKALGFGANVYWEGGKDSKYSRVAKEEYKCCRCGEPFKDTVGKDGTKYTAEQVYHMSEKANGEPICRACRDKKETAVE